MRQQVKRILSVGVNNGADVLFGDSPGGPWNRASNIIWTQRNALLLEARSGQCL